MKSTSIDSLAVIDAKDMIIEDIKDNSKYAIGAIITGATLIIGGTHTSPEYSTTATMLVASGSAMVAWGVDVLGYTAYNVMQYMKDSVTFLKNNCRFSLNPSTPVELYLSSPQ